MDGKSMKTADKAGLKASELVEKLQKLIEKHGDCRVFSIADYELIQSVEYRPQMEDFITSDEPLFFLDW